MGSYRCLPLFNRKGLLAFMVLASTWIILLFGFSDLGTELLAKGSSFIHMTSKKSRALPRLQTRITMQMNKHTSDHEIPELWHPREELPGDPESGNRDRDTIVASTSVPKDLISKELEFPSLWYTSGGLPGDPVSGSRDRDTIIVSTSVPNDLIFKRELTLRNRQWQITDKCKGNYSYFKPRRARTTSLKKRLYKNDEHKLLYCGIEKIGSSFWKRIFKVLDQRNKTNVHLFDMTGMSAHVGIPSSMKVANMSEREIDKIIATYTSFMFTRDPFTRLFSGYVDKMYLPNSVGVFYAKQIAKRVRKPKSEFCTLNTTFEMVSNYISDCIISSRSCVEGHFAPVFEHCEPCNVNYTYVGKMETFMEDTNYILSSAGLSLSNIAGSGEDHETDEMNDKGLIRDLAIRTFQYAFKKGDQSCLERKDTVARLWRTYQIRGIISKTDNLPVFQDLESLTIKNFISAAWDVYDKSQSSRDERQKQRDEALQEAYSSLPTSVLQKLSRAFDKDCKLFGYDCNVLERFRPARTDGFSYLTYKF